ncbi:polyprenyl synthetase family protein [Carnobacteriaceae bacterium zg-ZUI240]|nr:polyprenyl synthetase family protein [Carnobacteriaceae bacterium zg-ZUI240]
MVHHIWDSHPTIKEQLNKVQSIMLNELTPTHPDVLETVKSYILSSGKFIRAALCILFAEQSGHLNEKTLYRAASIEILHLATLIHDDVIDRSDTRRNLPSFHQQFDNRIAIYAGDYLLAYSARLAKKGYVDGIESFGNDRILELVLSGELRQLMHQYDKTITLAQYLKQIRGKTAQLFGLATQAGVLYEGVTPSTLRNAYQAGIALGMAFQLHDDLIDYSWDKNVSGKPRFQDIQNGIYTAPVLYSGSYEAWSRYIPENNKWSIEDLTTLLHHLESSGALFKTRALMEKYLARFNKRVHQLFDDKATDSVQLLLKQLF